MAKQTSRLQQILSILGGGFDFSDRLPTTDVAVNARVVSIAERDKLMKVSTQSDRLPQLTSTGGQSGFLLHAQKLLTDIAHNKIENSRILEMAPEVSQAASIMVPSIMSPNDLRSSAISIISTCSQLTESENKKIGEILTTFFEDHLHLSTVVPQWIHNALYRSGSVPVMILPLVTLENELTRGDHVMTSQESFHNKLKYQDNISSYGIADSVNIRTAGDINTTRTTIASATESFALDHILRATVESDMVVKPPTNYSKNLTTDAYTKLVDSVLSQESISIIDNAGSLQVSKTNVAETKRKITDRTKLRYRESMFVTIKAPDPNEKQIDHPIFMPLPSESVIPIYTPGSPTDHVGYFVLLTEHGHPIEITSDMLNATDRGGNTYTPNQTSFQQLFQAYGMGNFAQNDHRAQNAMTEIYQNIIETHLRDRLAKAGYGNLGIGKANNIYQFMLTRYLQQRRTKLLFVPKDLLTYFCFDYDEYGTGKSKLEELKFILALRISLIVCRMLVAFNNAIDRKKIEITFDSNFTGNVLEHMRTVQREAMRKSAVSFTHDPMAVAQQIVNRSYTVKARGIAGIPDYDITNESNQKNDASPDEELATDLKNLLILKLDVPAAAMNNLGEAEYSRSVVTTNLFFSRATLAKQKVVVTHLDDIIQKFLTYSEKLRGEIHDVYKTKHNDAITPEGSTNQIDKDIMDKIIAGVHSYLPPPNVAPDKSQFEALDGLLSSIDSILNSVMNDDIASGNTELGTLLTNLRGLRKSKLVQKYIQDFGFGDMEIPHIDDLDSEALLVLRQALLNMSAAVKKQDDVLVKTSTPAAADATTTQDSDYNFSSEQEPNQTFEPPQEESPDINF